MTSIAPHKIKISASESRRADKIKNFRPDSFFCLIIKKAILATHVISIISQNACGLTNFNSIKFTHLLSIPKNKELGSGAKSYTRDMPSTLSF